MGQIGALYTFSPNTIIRSTQANSNFSDIKTAYNAHDTAVNGVHGVSSGAIMGTAVDESVTGAKTFGVGKLLVDTETRYYSINPTAFHSHDGATEDDKYANGSMVRNNDGAFALRYFVADVNLPHGATITSFKYNYFRDDAASSLEVDLRRASSVGAIDILASIVATGTTGDDSEEDTTISNAVVDNNNYTYHVWVTIDTNNNVLDVYLYNVIITYTLTQPLP